MMRQTGTAVFLACVALALSATGCSSQNTRLEQHKKTFESLGATAAAIIEVWVGGQVSGTYARAALEKTFQLVEKERAALTTAPATLQDPRGAELSQKAERLSRLLADLMRDVAGGDGASARQHISEIPIRAAEQR
jgi:hypothetical protein